MKRTMTAGCSGKPGRLCPCAADVLQQARNETGVIQLLTCRAAPWGSIDCVGKEDVFLPVRCRGAGANPG